MCTPEYEDPLSTVANAGEQGEYNIIIIYSIVMVAILHGHAFYHIISNHILLCTALWCWCILGGGANIYTSFLRLLVYVLSYDVSSIILCTQWWITIHLPFIYLSWKTAREIQLPFVFPE